MDVNGKVIIVTGASEGIGLAAVKLLASKGAKLALAARSAGKLDALAGELPDSIAIPTDMTDLEAVRRMVARTHEHFGRVDVLVNNAGQGIYGALEHVDPDEYRRVIELNVLGPLVAMQAAIPLMRAQGGGAIVNISSMLAKMYIPRLSAYAATKYALTALSLTARQELAGDNIVVSVVFPGLTETRFGENAVKSDTAAQGMASRTRPDMPAPDSAEHVAERILLAIESGAAEVLAHDQ